MEGLIYADLVSVLCLFFFGDLRLFRTHLSLPFTRLNSVISFFFELISSQWSGDFIANG